MYFFSHISVWIFCTLFICFNVVIKSIRNIHAVSINKIAEILNLTDNILYRTVASCNTENHFTPFSYFSISFFVQNVCNQIGQEDTKLAVFTAWKVSKYGVFLVRIFPYLDWIQRFTKYGDLLRKSPYSVSMRENTNQQNSVFGQF